MLEPAPMNVSAMRGLARQWVTIVSVAGLCACGASSNGATHGDPADSGNDIGNDAGAIPPPGKTAARWGRRGWPLRLARRRGGASTVTIGAPSQATVADAIGTTLLSYYHPDASTGDIWCLPCDGAPVTLAAASYVGNTMADAQLLAQMRYLLQTGNEPFGTGGYAANDERNATAMYAIAKLVPRVWSQLTAAELTKINLIAEAAFVSDVVRDEPTRRTPAARLARSTGATTRTATTTPTTARG